MPSVLPGRDLGAPAAIVGGFPDPVYKSSATTPGASSATVDLPARLRALGSRANRAAAWLWAIASTAVLALFFGAVRRLSAARRRWEAAVVEGVPVMVPAHAGPAVVGVRRPIAVIPRWVVDAPAEARRLVLRHESEHLDAGEEASGAILIETRRGPDE